MIEKHCIGPDVGLANISPEAEISGSSYITGPRTRIAAGAVIRDSRLHDAAVEAGAQVIDSMLLAEGHGHKHKCDSAARTVVSAADQPAAGAGAVIRGSTLVDSSVGARTQVIDSWIADSRIGDDGLVRQAKIIITNTGSHIRVTGPTEISESYVGHHARIDQRGYLEGIFGNAFRLVKFDPASGKLTVTGQIDLPHVSRYGVNTINSTNSGKLQDQQGRPVASYGKPGGLWRGESFLSHEQIELGPCCWVAPWTKVVGQSAQPHHTDDQLVNDELSTYLMPFALAGYQGEMTRGLVMPGELSTGLGTKQRRGAWVFTYAPDAVFRMVARLHEALEPRRKAVADTIVIEAIKVALEMTKWLARKNEVDLSLPLAQQRPGWPKWLGQTFALLFAHLEQGLWQFKGGKPTEWSQEGGKWVHPRLAAVLAIAPDALQKQVSEEEIFRFADPVPPAGVALPSGELVGTGGPPVIDPGAKIAPGAFIGPGCRIGPTCVVGSGAELWNAVLQAASVGPRSRVYRSQLTGATVGADCVVRSCRMEESDLGDNSTAQCATILASKLSDQTTVSCFADVRQSTCNYGAIIGGRFHHAELDVYLMSMHMAGSCQHLQAVPIEVEVGGRRQLVRAIPMIGGGSVIRGQPGRPVRMQCTFVGSNAIIEPDTYLGFGCFLLGTVGPNWGLLPFTVSTDGQVAHHSVGAALSLMASTVMTHFIPWVYSAAGDAGAPAVAEMIKAACRQGLSAVEWETARRAGKTCAGGAAFAKYRCLSLYSDQQLAAAKTNYTRALESGAWDLAFVDGELRFVSAKGTWMERAGSALWKPAAK